MMDFEFVGTILVIAVAVYAFIRFSIGKKYEPYEDEWGEWD